MAFGLQLGSTVSAGRTPSNQRQFVVTELRQNDVGAFVETPERFVWDVNTQSSPRPSWTFGLKQRSVRTDYTGADEPSEQVLGPAYKPFTISGIWDDRYAGEGFARATLEAFEQLVARGNLVRITFETLTATGLITDFDPEYVRENYIRYAFTVSHHFRRPGGIARTQKPQIPASLARPEELVDAVDKSVLDAVNTQNGLSGQLLTVSNVINDVGEKVTSMVAKVDEAKQILDNQFFGPIEQVTDSLKRMAGQMRVIRGVAQDVLTSVAGIVADVDLIAASAVEILEFEDWKRGIAYQMRLTIGQADAAEAQFNERVEPDLRAVYRPRAGENLYGISLRFYNTPDNWRAIADANNLSYITLTGEESLLIPNIR